MNNEWCRRFFFFYNDVISEVGVYGKFAICFLGSVGNIFIIILLVQNKIYYESTNIFIFNLAVADLTVCITNIFHTIANFKMNVSSQNFIIHFIIYSYCVLVSQYNLAVILKNRYFFVLKSKENYENLYFWRNFVFFDV